VTVREIVKPEADAAQAMTECYKHYRQIYPLLKPLFRGN